MSHLPLLIPIGVLIGVLLGSVGGGGSLVAVPALVYVGDQSVRGAQAGALVVVVAASTIGLAAYLRRGDVRRRAGLAFGAAAGASSFAGSVLSRHLDPNVLLLAFAPVMVLGAVAMVGERGRAASTFRPWREGVSPGPVARVTFFGLATGWLTGLFGVGGGFVIVPVLVLGLGFGLMEAIGTSLLVIIIGSLVALAERVGGGAIDWGVIVPFAAAAVAGVLVGSAVGGRVSTPALTRWFALLVVATAVFTATKAVIALG
ncbi:MAG TPA: sulfite exporter TauE/SafE family protein [Solirubrobacterales bacterium]|nr:sulfite exporter TauE/SafE family protein [Solirubrobacterales bacterium]